MRDKKSFLPDNKRYFGSWDSMPLGHVFGLGLHRPLTPEAETDKLDCPRITAFRYVKDIIRKVKSKLQSGGRFLPQPPHLPRPPQG